MCLVEARRQQLLQALRDHIAHTSSRVAAALPSVSLPSVSLPNSAEYVQQAQRRTALFIERHPLAESLLKTLNTKVLPTVLPARLHSVVQHYLAFLSLEHNEAEAALADDEEEHDDSLDVRSLSGDHADLQLAPLSPTEAQQDTATPEEVPAVVVVEAEAVADVNHVEPAISGDHSISYAEAVKPHKKKSRGKHAHAHIEDVD